MKRFFLLALFLWLVGCTALFAGNTWEYDEQNKVIRVEYNLYGLGMDEGGSVQWQAGNQNILREVVYETTDYWDWVPVVGESFMITIKGVASHTGELQAYLVDERQEAGWWSQLSQVVLTAKTNGVAGVVAGQEFELTGVFPIDNVSKTTNDNGAFPVGTEVEGGLTSPGIVLCYTYPGSASDEGFNSQEPFVISNAEVEVLFAEAVDYENPIRLDYAGKTTENYIYQNQSNNTVVQVGTVHAGNYANVNFSGKAINNVDILSYVLADKSLQTEGTYFKKTTAEYQTFATNIQTGDDIRAQFSYPLENGSNPEDSSSMQFVDILMAISSEKTFACYFENATLEVTVTEEPMYRILGEEPNDDDRFYVDENGVLTVPDKSKISGDVVIPEVWGGKNVTSIGASSFSNCTKLSSITIPSSVSSIGSNAFYLCENLSKISVASITPPITNNSFDNYNATLEIPCDGYENYINASEWSWFYNVVRIDCVEGYVIIDGIKYGYYEKGTAFVTCGESYADGVGAYSGNIEIPSVITVNGKEYTVTEIGTYAFRFCENLISVKIPESVKTIKGYAFDHCSKLTSIIIPKSVEAIEFDVLDYCPELSSIKVDYENPIYDSREDCNAIIESATNILKYGCKNTIIPETVTEIESFAFNGCSNLTSIEIPKSVISIKAYAFSQCEGLTAIVIPKSVKSINSRSFCECSQLSSIRVDTENPTYDSRNDCNAIIESETNTIIEGFNNTIIPENIVIIGKDAFWGCSGFTSIVIPNSVEIIDSWAFYSCNNLSSITISSSVTTIKDLSFGYCNALTQIFCFAVEPPTLKSNSFTNYDATLIVPCESFELYKNHEIWGQFANIECVGAKEYDVLINSCNIDIKFDNNIEFTNQLKGATLRAGDKINLTIKGFFSAPVTVSVNCVSDNSYNADGNGGYWNMLSDWMTEELGTAVANEEFEATKTIEITTSALTNEKYIVRFDFAMEPQDQAVYGTHIKLRPTKFNENLRVDMTTIPDISLNEGEAMPILNLSEYFSTPDPNGLTYEVRSSNNAVVYPTVLGERLGFVQYGSGTAKIDVIAASTGDTVVGSFSVTVTPINTRPQLCELTITAEQTDVTCFGGSDGKVEIFVSGGVEPYQFKWNTGRTSSGIYAVTAGEYSVLVWDSVGCAVTNSFVVTEPKKIVLSESITNPSCGESNGELSVAVSGGNAPYTYVWRSGDGELFNTQTITNLKSGIYDVTITDKKMCTAQTSFSLPESGAPTITLKNVWASKCNAPTGGFEIEVNGGEYPYVFSWSDSLNVPQPYRRPRMYPGMYKVTVRDAHNCRSMLPITVPVIPFKQPEIALVTFGDVSHHNIVVWQKEATDEIDKYYIYRETDIPGDYQEIGFANYNDLSLFVDESANPTESPSRYRISAGNSCWRSPLSGEKKTINLKLKEEKSGAISLFWDAYEGSGYVSYTLYRVHRHGVEKVCTVPANKVRYVAPIPPKGTIGYYVSIDLNSVIDIAESMKSESGPFAIAISNIAELENTDITVTARGHQILVKNIEDLELRIYNKAGYIVYEKSECDENERFTVDELGTYYVEADGLVFKVVVDGSLSVGTIAEEPTISVCGNAIFVEHASSESVEVYDIMGRKLNCRVERAASDEVQISEIPTNSCIIVVKNKAFKVVMQ